MDGCPLSQHALGDFYSSAQRRKQSDPLDVIPPVSSFHLTTAVLVDKAMHTLPLWLFFVAPTEYLFKSAYMSQDYEEAFSWYLSAAKNANVPSMFAVAQMLKSGRGTKKVPSL